MPLWGLFFQYLEPCTTLHTRRYNVMSWFKNILFPKMHAFWSLRSAQLPTSSVNICRCKWKRWRRTIPPSWWSPHSASATSWSTRSDHYMYVSVTKLTPPTISTLKCQKFLFLQFGCILVFLSGVIFPILFTFVHASLRLRNAKNKVCPFSFWPFLTCYDSENMFSINDQICKIHTQF